MSTRLLYIFALLTCGLAAYVYFHKDALEKQAGASHERYDYWAENIRATQTDDMGRANVTVAAKRLVHDPLSKEMTLTSLDAQMLGVGQGSATYSFHADSAIWHQPSYVMSLVGNVEMARVQTSLAEDNPLLFRTDALRANTKTKQVSSDGPVTFVMLENGKQISQFQAAAMKADLTRGEYQFDTLQAEYAP